MNLATTVLAATSFVITHHAFLHDHIVKPSWHICKKTGHTVTTILHKHK